MALSADRDTPRRDGAQYEYPADADLIFYAGALVVLDSSGNAEPATTATGKIAAGVCTEYLDTTGLSAGDKKVKVATGVFRFVNGETITKAHIGDAAYASDDQTIYRTATGKSQVGLIKDVDDLGVWVEIQAPTITTGLLAANNLSDIGSVDTAIDNLELTDGSKDLDLNDVEVDTLLATEQATLAGGYSLDADAAAPVRKLDVVTVTATQLRTLAASPKTLVGAPGAGKVLVFKGAMISYRGGSNAFNSVGAGEDLAVRYENGSGALCSPALDTTTDINFGATTDADAYLAPLAAAAVVTPANKALVLDNIGAGELASTDADANGDGIVTVVIEYEVHTVVA